MDAERIFFSDQKILVVGDYILDQYLGGDVDRISPEAPVPVLKSEWIKYCLGGAGNVVNNIESLKATARVLTCIGAGKTGAKLMDLLKESGADIRYVLQDPSVSTTKKIRIVARNQQVIRIDDEEIGRIPAGFLDYIKENIEGIFDSIHAVIISDYGKGIVSDDVCKYLLAESKMRGIPVFVDPKGADWNKYTNAVSCTPNLSELSVVYGSKLSNDDEEKIHEVGLAVCRKYNFDYLLVTRSEKGMSLIMKDGTKYDYPVKKKEVIDVSGAGDTVITTFTLCTTIGLDLDACCKVANLAASIVISKFGTATVTINELIESLVIKNTKIIKRGDLEILSKYLHDVGKKIVFTNGCFDILHAGHVESLTQARSKGDVLIVGLNSDASVCRLKGPTRPIVSQDNRAQVLQALSCVDYVTIFDEDTPYEVIKTIRPNVLVKGKDYENKVVVGQDIVEANGGKVELIDLVPGLSTSSIVQKIIKNSK